MPDRRYPGEPEDPRARRFASSAGLRLVRNAEPDRAPRPLTDDERTIAANTRRRLRERGDRRRT
ncbi:MAG: hypothetical protein AB7G37_00890 [Solirubrobacteraceae bacterium]